MIQRTERQQGTDTKGQNVKVFPVVVKRQRKKHMEKQIKQHKEASMSMLLPEYYSEHKGTVKGVALWPRGCAGLND